MLGDGGALIASGPDGPAGADPNAEMPTGPAGFAGGGDSTLIDMGAPEALFNAAMLGESARSRAASHSGSFV